MAGPAQSHTKEHAGTVSNVGRCYCGFDLVESSGAVIVFPPAALAAQIVLGILIGLVVFTRTMLGARQNEVDHSKTDICLSKQD